jgi:Fic family protein
VPGEYTDTDMCAGDTVFGDHEQLIARIPALLSSTQQAMDSASVHPMVLAARFHGYFEYLHPFRDGNGRIGRLFSNFILHKSGHPIVIIRNENKGEYISALRSIRTENTDEHLIAFFFRTAIERMKQELKDKKKGTALKSFLF